ncbi:unnamed protein product [Chrysoparadoxa australica]
MRLRKLFLWKLAVIALAPLASLCLGQIISPTPFVGFRDFPYALGNGTGGTAGQPLPYTRGGRDPDPGNSARPSPLDVVSQLHLEPPPSRPVADLDLGMNQLWAYWGMLVWQGLYEPQGRAFPSDANLECSDPTGAGGGTGGAGGTFEAINAATTALDLDSLYGRDEATLFRLRAPLNPNEPDGARSAKMLLTEQGLPFYHADGGWLIANPRRQETLGTLALHTLLLREHNRRVDEMRETLIEEWDAKGLCEEKPCSEWDEEDVYNAAKMWTIATMQHVTNDEFMPITLGNKRALAEFGAFDESVSPAIEAFGTVALSWFLSVLSPIDRIIGADLQPVAPEDPVTLHKGMRHQLQHKILTKHGLDSVLRGTIFQPAQNLDITHDEDVADYSLAIIELGRDLGVPAYNVIREAYGLPAVADFEELVDDDAMVARLRALYGDISSLDAIVGALLERVPEETRQEVNQPRVPPLLHAAISDQALRSVSGDRHWHYHSNQLTAVQSVLIAKLIKRNPDDKEKGFGTVPDFAFFRQQVLPSNIPGTSTQDSMMKAGGKLTDRYSLAWRVVEDPVDDARSYVDFTLTFIGMGPDGYLALGIGEDMGDADIMAFIEWPLTEEGKPKITDRTSRAQDTPTIDRSQDTEIVSFSEEEGISRVTVRRKLVTGDPDDKELIRGEPFSLIWSFNDASTRQKHGLEDRGQIIVDLLSGTSEKVEESKGFFVLHGIVMLAAFGITGPAAWFVVRYCKRWKYWLEIHVVLAMFTAEATIPIAIGAMATSAGNVFETKHGKVGLFILAGMCVQVGSGFFRRMGIENKMAKWFGSNYGKLHQCNKYFHRSLGRLLFLIGIVNVYVGLGQLSPSDSNFQLEATDQNGGDGLTIKVTFFKPLQEIWLFVWLALWATAFAVAEVRRWTSHKLEHLRDFSRLNKPAFSLEDFNYKILQGEQWIIVQGMIVDIADYIKVHPGGSRILKQCIGTDVTPQLMGQARLGEDLAQLAHKHSSNAWSLLNTKIIGAVNEHEEVAELSPPAPSRTSIGKSYAKIGSKLKNSLGLVKDLTELKKGKPWRGRVPQAFVSYVLLKKECVTDAGSPRPVYKFVLSPADSTVPVPCPKPGHYVKFRLVHHHVVIQRSYTQVQRISVGDGREALVFYIRILPLGSMSSALDHLKPGDGLSIQGPFEMVKLGAYRNILMLAGGTGISPMLELARAHLDISLQSHMPAGFTPAQRLRLLWQSNDDRSAFCMDDLEELARMGDGSGYTSFQYVMMCKKFYYDKGLRSKLGQLRDTFKTHFQEDADNPTLRGIRRSFSILDNIHDKLHSAVSHHRDSRSNSRRNLGEDGQDACQAHKASRLSPAVSSRKALPSAESSESKRSSFHSPGRASASTKAAQSQGRLSPNSLQALNNSLKSAVQSRRHQWSRLSSHSSDDGKDMNPHLRRPSVVKLLTPTKAAKLGAVSSSRATPREIDLPTKRKSSNEAAAAAAVAEEEAAAESPHHSKAARAGPANPRSAWIKWRNGSLFGSSFGSGSGTCRDDSDLDEDEELGKAVPRRQHLPDENYMAQGTIDSTIVRDFFFGDGDQEGGEQVGSNDSSGEEGKIEGEIAFGNWEPLAERKDTLVLVSGPVGFVEGMEHLLKVELGLPECMVTFFD